MKKMYYALPLLLLAIVGCRKFLDQKSDKTLVVPASLQDLQAILDNTYAMNVTYPFTPELSADNYYITTDTWQSRSITERNAYIWSDDLFNDQDRNDWSMPYNVVYNSNVVLGALKKESFNNAPPAGKANIAGQAHFFRAFAFYNLLQVFAKPYDPDSAAHDWGIALRLDPDLNKPTQRASVEASYAQVLSDLQMAAGELSAVPQVKTRPSKPAAYALLARVFLSMSRYGEALTYADSALGYAATLLDYNALNPAATRPFSLFNAEVIFHSTMVSVGTLISLSKVDTTLYASYEANDLRRSLFYNAASLFKGSYEGTSRMFIGMATDELYLIKAECLARAGRVPEAMNTLNGLLVKRWKTGTFIPLEATSETEALQKILAERRKELVFRNQRWTDLRRLNKDPRFAVTLTRIINSQEYHLYPNDRRYVLPLPAAIVQATGVPQNPR